MNRICFCLLAFSTVLAADACLAQVVTFGVRMRSLQGEIVGVSGRKILWEYEGQRGPIPYDGTTRLTVSARGDTGFVAKGSLVAVAGTLQRDKSVNDATISVYTNPRSGGAPQTVYFDPVDPQLSFRGRVVNLNPLTVKSVDGLSANASNQNNGLGAPSPPVFGSIHQVKLRDPNPESIRLVLGSAANLIEAGDRVTVSFAETNPKVAYSVSVTKDKVFESPAKKRADTKKPAEDDETEKPESN